MLKNEVKNNWSGKWKSLGLVILLTVMFQSLSYAETKQYQTEASQSKVWFEVESTLHDVHGEAKSFTGKVIFDKETGKVSLPMQIEIMVAAMETGNSRRDKDMREMFQSEQYPVIRWTAAQINCPPGKGSDATVCEAMGSLEIRNIKRGKNFQVLLTFHEGQIQAKGDWSLERKDFELKTPSLLGIVRVGQKVKIKFDTIWVLEK